MKVEVIINESGIRQKMVERKRSIPDLPPAALKTATGTESEI